MAEWRVQLLPEIKQEVHQGTIYLSHKLKLADLPYTNENKKVLDEFEKGISFANPQDLPNKLGKNDNVYDKLLNTGLLQIILKGSSSNQAVCTLHKDHSDFLNCSFTREAKYVWSRFVLIRKNGKSWLVESPLSSCTIEIFGKESWEALNLLTDQQEWQVFINKASSIDCEYLNKLKSILVSHCFLIDEAKNRENNAPLKTWEFHDLYFHSRSRMGRHSNGMGGNYRFKEEEPSAPAIRKPHEGPLVKLPEPNPYWYTNRDLTFTAVVEYRRSYRLNGMGNLTLYQLSEFLYRSCRIRSLDNSNPMMEISNRPYPNGGASYELEIYLTIHRCQGLESSGFYYYCPHEHHLVLLKSYNQEVQKNMEMATWSTGQNYPPPVLINIAARFKRVSWKYEGIAYALILKNTGVLYHQFYLVATAMGLNPCGVGVGDSEHFAKISGLEYTEENTVGELILNGIYTPS